MNNLNIPVIVQSVTIPTAGKTQTNFAVMRLSFKNTHFLINIEGAEDPDRKWGFLNSINLKCGDKTMSLPFTVGDETKMSTVMKVIISRLLVKHGALDEDYKGDVVVMPTATNNFNELVNRLPRTTNDVLILLPEEARPVSQEEVNFVRMVKYDAKTRIENNYKDNSDEYRQDLLMNLELGPFSPTDWVKFFESMERPINGDEHSESVFEFITEEMVRAGSYCGWTDNVYGVMFCQTAANLLQHHLLREGIKFEHIPVISSYDDGYFGYTYHLLLAHSIFKGNYEYGTSPNTAWFHFEEPVILDECHYYPDNHPTEGGRFLYPLVNKELFLGMLLGVLSYYNDWCKRIGTDRVKALLINHNDTDIKYEDFYQEEDQIG